jgi:hypothetical protein
MENVPKANTTAEDSLARTAWYEASILFVIRHRGFLFEGILTLYDASPHRRRKEQAIR